MSDINSDWEEWKKTEAQGKAQIFAEFEKVLEEQARFSNFVDEWVSAIGEENIQFIKGKNIIFREYFKNESRKFRKNRRNC